jgi:hypothetical protein
MMTAVKRLVILANSIKHLTGACIAGREIVSDGIAYHLGDWIRPVSDHGEGELAPRECVLASGKAHRIPKRIHRGLVVESLAKHCGEIRAEHLT